MSKNKVQVQKGEVNPNIKVQKNTYHSQFSIQRKEELDMIQKMQTCTLQTPKQ